MTFKLVQCQAIFINNGKWTKTLVKQVNMQTFEERNTKSPGTKVGASREEQEAINCLESIPTLEQHSKHFLSQTSGWQKEPVYQSLATIDQLVSW